MSDPAPVGWYGRHVAALASAHEALDPAMIHAWLLDLLPNVPALVLDMGAGTGRNAAWLI